MWMAANVSLCRRMKKGKQENAGAALGSPCVYCLRSVDCRTFILKSKGIESAEKFLLERLTEAAPPGCLLPAERDGFHPGVPHQCMVLLV